MATGIILVTLFALVGQMDNRYPTRLEYVATMHSIDTQLADIKTEVHAHVTESAKGTK